MGKDVHATIAVDESLLKEYNEKMNLDYEVLPADKYTFEKEVVIESGKTMAKPTVVTINPYEAAEGVKYALPIRVSSDGSIQEERQGTKIHFITRQTVVTVYSLSEQYGRIYI